MHEAQYHDENQFLTLTYDDDKLPPGGTLVPEHFTLFLKRYRKYLFDRKIRYYHCGEYGDNLGRPHYHALIFGHTFSDRRWHSRSKSGHDIYTSPTLDKLWGHGFCQIGTVTLQSAQYVAKYIIKRITGDLAESHYTRVIPDTGEIIRLHPEYTTMSRCPGIGAQWFQDFKADAFPCDHIVMDGKKNGVPKYYTRQLKKEDQDTFNDVKKSRRKQQLQREVIRNNQPARLAVRETVKTAQVNLTKRDL